MQVLDILEEYEGHNIRIGTSEGSAFIWLGTVTDDLPAELMDTWRQFQRLFDTRIMRLEKRLVSAEKHIRFYNRDSILFRATYADIQNIKGNLKEAKECRRKCTNILKREVVNKYPSISEPNTMIFIIEGKEAGRAWYLEEWLKQHGGKAKATN